MKRLMIPFAFLFLLVAATTAHARYPVSSVSMVTPDVAAKTTVRLVSGMQVAMIVFKSQSGTLGAITLSPVQPSASNIELRAGDVTLQLDRILFQAAFGLQGGQVQVQGTSNGSNGNIPFNRIIMSWVN